MAKPPSSPLLGAAISLISLRRSAGIQDNEAEVGDSECPQLGLPAVWEEVLREVRDGRLAVAKPSLAIFWYALS